METIYNKKIFVRIGFIYCLTLLHLHVIITCTISICSGLPSLGNREKWDLRQIIALHWRDRSELALQIFFLFLPLYAEYGMCLLFLLFFFFAVYTSRAECHSGMC
ncbi:hypothetical protein DAI22_01g216600 [Oryza sativa Japonica Group]|nr:hypothetical protein DAI22_01g216600 [Oryza sativa Japonica Group]